MNRLSGEVVAPFNHNAAPDDQSVAVALYGHAARAYRCAAYAYIVRPLGHETTVNYGFSSAGDGHAPGEHLPDAEEHRVGIAGAAVGPLSEPRDGSAVDHDVAARRERWVQPRAGRMLGACRRVEGSRYRLNHQSPPSTVAQSRRSRS